MANDNDEPSAASAGSLANHQTKHDGSPEPKAHLPNTVHAGCRSRESDAGTGDIVEHRWIPVSERLPEPWENVLIAVRGEYVFLGCVTSGGGWRGNGDMIQDGVTHWMPLPAPPTDAK